MLLEARNISKSFNGVKVLNCLSFSLRRGGRYALIGPSGSGKSVLFNILGRLTKADSGAIITAPDAAQASYMQQKDLLLPWLTVADNVTLPLTLGGMPRKAARQEAALLWAEFGLAGYEEAFPAELSGGMRQRAALMRALLYNKPLLLMDEPFSALDALTALQMRLFVKKTLDTFERTLFFITHNIDEALDTADEIFILKGRPAAIGNSITVEPAAHAAQRQHILSLLGVAPPS
jgi:ABC-type nitrate/sulfonate/bicarbonate transport system ATPase subunit